MIYERVVLYNNQKIQYILEIKKVKNINLRIKSDCKIYVSANEKVPFDYIDSFILKNAKTIIKTLNKFSEINKHKNSAKQYINGESFYILGKNLRLKVIENSEEKIYNDGVFIYLYTKNPLNFNKKKKIFDNYIRNLAYENFNEITKNLYLKFIKYNVPIPIIEVRTMQKRWGSCIPAKNKINLNINLIQSPKNCIEFVIMHELCHFIHPNHSKNFYDFLTILMPDWKERKIALENQFINMLY